MPGYLVHRLDRAPAAEHSAVLSSGCSVEVGLSRLVNSPLITSGWFHSFDVVCMLPVFHNFAQSSTACPAEYLAVLLISTCPATLLASSLRCNLLFAVLRLVPPGWSQHCDCGL